MSSLDPGFRLPEAAVALLDALPETVLVADDQARIVHLHPLSEKLLGTSSAAALGQNLDGFLASLDDRPYALDYLRELLERGPDAVSTAIVRHVSGVHLRRLLAGRATRIDGRSLWFLSLRAHPPGPARDQDVYRAIFDRAPIGLSLVDHAGTITAVNEAFAASIGSPRAVLLGMNVFTLPDRQIVADVRAALEGHEVRRQRTYRSATGGKTIEAQLLITPVRDESGHIVGALTISADVTALVDAGRSLERVISGAPDSISILRQGRWVLANSVTADTMGVASPADLIGRSVSEFLAEEDQLIFKARMARIAEVDALPPLEYRIRRGDGRERFIEVKTITIEHEGQPSALVFGRDITERRELETRLQQADRLAAVGTLAAGVAHEINNPLAYLMMTAEGLADRARRASLDPAGVLEDCENILDGGERIRTIVGDLSTFARRPDGQQTSVDVNRVVSAAANMVRHTLRHRAALFLELAPSLPPVRGDEARLAQVFVNLLVNAAQSIPEGQPGQHSVRVRSEQVGPRVRVSVRDTGQGMSTEVSKHIFEPFFTTKAPGVGTGLGLSIVHGIVESHGGSIHVESAPGRGSEFVLELPVDGAAARRPTYPPERPLAPPAHILIIDDEEAFASALSAALARHRIRVAHSGRAGLDLILEEPPPDLILCDVMMPGFTGMDVLDELNALRPWLTGRFVFMTGGAVTERARTALAQARCPVLQKPFSRDDVELILADLRRSAEAEQPRG